MDQHDIIISEQYPAQQLADYPGFYLNHILCLKGCVTFRMANRDFKLQHGDMAIFIPQTSPSGLTFSADYEGRHLLLSGRITNASNPSKHWGSRGYIFSFSNPVFHFTDGQIAVFERNLDVFGMRLEDRGHLFYSEVLISCVRTFLYDMWNIYAPELEKRITGGSEGGDHFERFMALLSLHSRKQREVRFYADKLFITPKYLSEVCRKKSGRSAMEWIKDYARQEIMELLKDSNLTVTDIAERMNFQNASFFCRYAKNVLGKTPTEYRNSQ